MGSGGGRGEYVYVFYVKVHLGGLGVASWGSSIRPGELRGGS